MPPHPRKGRRPSRRTARRREPREASPPPGPAHPRDRTAEHVGEVDQRGAFGVMIDAVTGREPHSKPADKVVPETETKRRRRRLAPDATQTQVRPSGRPRKGGPQPQSGSSTKQ